MGPLEALRKAGKIAAEVRDITIAEIRPGIKVEFICDTVNERVEKRQEDYV